MPGPNPLLLKWKDMSSGYFIDNTVGPLAARLKVGSDFSLLTYDGFRLENTVYETVDVWINKSNTVFTILIKKERRR